VTSEDIQRFENWGKRPIGRTQSRADRHWEEAVMSNANERNAEVIKAIKENPDLTYAEIKRAVQLEASSSSDIGE
jgi:hypothetical protein